jgi:hypothetical protein
MVSCHKHKPRICMDVHKLIGSHAKKWNRHSHIQWKAATKQHHLVESKTPTKEVDPDFRKYIEKEVDANTLNTRKEGLLVFR